MCKRSWFWLEVDKLFSFQNKDNLAVLSLCLPVRSRILLFKFWLCDFFFLVSSSTLMFFSSSFTLDRFISAPRFGFPAAVIGRVCPRACCLSPFLPSPRSGLKSTSLFSPCRRFIVLHRAPRFQPLSVTSCQTFFNWNQPQPFTCCSTCSTSAVCFPHISSSYECFFSWPWPGASSTLTLLECSRSCNYYTVHWCLKCD